MFCTLASKERKVKLYEDDDLYIIKDLHPKAEKHFLCISKRHIRDIWFLRDQDKQLLEKMKHKSLEFMKTGNHNI